MGRVFVGMLLGFLLFGLLLTGAYAARYTPEVLNCDRRRQSVVVRVGCLPLRRRSGPVRDRQL
jgi:hypothetical protein